MREQPDWIPEERARLAEALQDPRTEPTNYAIDGAEALWIASSNQAPEIGQLGFEMLERACDPTMLPRLDAGTHLEASTAIAFWGIHAAWSSGRDYTAEDARRAYRALEPAIRFAHAATRERRLSTLNLSRTLFLGMVARAGSTRALVLPAPPSVQGGYDGTDSPHDTFAMIDGTLTPTHTVARPHRSSGQSAIKLPLARTLLIVIRARDRPYFKKNIAPLTDAKQHSAGATYLAELIKNEYDNALTPDEGEMLTAMAVNVTNRLVRLVYSGQHRENSEAAEESSRQG